MNRKKILLVKIDQLYSLVNMSTKRQLTAKFMVCIINQ